MSELTTILGEAFDVDAEEGSTDFEPLPPGQYVATIKDANVGALKSGKGQAINLTFEVEGEKFAGRLIWDRVIVSHESERAMKFGRQKLKDIATACGVTGMITDLSVICHKPLMVTVKVETDDSGEYPPKNRVSRVRPIAKPMTNGSAQPDFNDKLPI